VRWSPRFRGISRRPSSIPSLCELARRGIDWRDLASCPRDANLGLGGLHLGQEHRLLGGCAPEHGEQLGEELAVGQLQLREPRAILSRLRLPSAQVVHGDRQRQRSWRNLRSRRNPGPGVLGRGRRHSGISDIAWPRGWRWAAEVSACGRDAARRVLSRPTAACRVITDRSAVYGGASSYASYARFPGDRGGNGVIHTPYK
jgi:hypothetical protein